MAVANYIHDLLYRYECVILPGFGAFITQQSSARIHTSTNEFYPPRKTVSFNRQLVKNDGLLANYIVETENIGYQQALEKLHHFVQELQNVLDDHKSVNFGEVGSFRLSEDDKLEFEPASQKNYLKDAFGLASFPAVKIARQEEAVAPEEKPVIEFEPEKRSSGSWFKYAAVGLLTIGLSGAAGINLYQDQINDHNLAEQRKAANQLETQIQKATFVIDNPLPAVTLKVSRQSGNFHVVAGAFRLEENAEAKVQELKAQGYKARKTGANRFGLHQVLYSSHESRRDAINALNSVKRTSNPGAWLLVEEL